MINLSERPGVYPDYQELSLDQSVEAVGNLYNRFNPSNPGNLEIEIFAGRIPASWINSENILADIAKATRKSERMPTDLVVAAIANPDHRVGREMSLLQPFTPIEMAMLIILPNEFHTWMMFRNQLQLRGKPARDYVWPTLDEADRISKTWARKYRSELKREDDMAVIEDDEIIESLTPEEIELRLAKSKALGLRTDQYYENPKQLNIWDAQKSD